MQQIWTNMRTWFMGKKTMIGGVVVIAAAGVSCFLGHLSVANAVLVAGLGFSICGKAAKDNRLLAALSNVAQAGVDLRLGDKAGALAELKPLAMTAGVSLVPQAAATLHLSAANGAELQGMVDELATPMVSRVKDGATA